jgi:prophage DNA circulation protein
MSWRDELQTASFRGAEFAVADAETLFGRRNVLHEYPLRDNPFTEDLGKKAREYTINAFVIGDDYTSARDALMSAIEDDETPGTLVHPTLGSMLVIPKDCRVKFNNKEGGIEYFALTFVEAGSDALPSFGADTSFLSEATALTSIDSFSEHFSNTFNVVGLPDFLHTSALQNLIGTSSSTAAGGGTDFVSSIENIFKAGSFGSDNEDYTAIKNMLKNFESSASDDIYEPETLAENVTEIVSKTSDVYVNKDTTDNFVDTVRPNDPLMTALEAQKRLQAFGSTFIAPPLTTPERIQESENTIQLVNLVVNVSLAQIVIIMSQIDFPSRQDAVDTRNAVDVYFQAQILNLADRGEDVPYEALNKARSAMIKDVNSRASTLKNKKYVTTADPMPAIVFAYDQYEDAERDEEIVQRNRIRNPVFIPQYSRVEILA